MKKLLLVYAHSILANFKFYRKLTGGVWYKYREKDLSGFAAGSEYWTQESRHSRWDVEIDMEEY